MAVTKEQIGCGVALTLETGMTVDGSTKYGSKTFSVINPAATDQAIFDFAAGVGSLQTFPVAGITKIEKYSLVSA